MVRFAVGHSSRALAGGAILVLALGGGCGGESSTSDDDDDSAGASGESGSGGVDSGGGGTTSDGGTTSGGTTTGGAGSTNRGGTGGGAGSSGGSGGGSGGGLEEIVSGEYYPYWLAIDDAYVFWISRNELKRAPLSGGEVVTLATSQSPALNRVTAASGYAYFTDSPGRTVSRVDREGGPVEELGGGVYPEGVFVLGESVYWTNRGMTVGEEADGTLASASIDGSGDRVLAEGVTQPSGIAVDGEFVYFTSASSSCTISPEGSECIGGGVSKVPLEGGAPEPVDTEGTPMDVVLGEDAMYWVIDSPTRVKFAPRGGGAVGVLATLPSESAGPVAVDAEAVYLSSAGDGRVVKIPLDGSAPFPVAVDLGYTYGIAVDESWVYIAASTQGRIVRVKKDGSAAEPGGPITGPCPTPVGSAEEIAATPRADENFEFLALELDEGEVTATDETYDRVRADVARIRELAPDLADIDHTPRSEGKSLIMMTSDIAGQSMLAGDYSAWDCLNEFYGLESLLVEEFAIGVVAVIELKGNYALDVLSSVYGELPGIEGVDPGVVPADGPTICAARDGDIYEYVVDRAAGDCLLGCTTHDAHHFRSTAPGEIQVLETWNSESGTSSPVWFNSVCR